MVKRGETRKRFFQDFDVKPWVQGMAFISLACLALYIYQGKGGTREGGRGRGGGGREGGWNWNKGGTWS
ncbi:hypothetical protein NSK_007438 [Nannochloropsis salina CCMP1776]|uniref:Uncharacterized protein n=1 Tax=Nannochloropsis salina CCMP1776 TaxID=1027361 RepID=A0A4D9CPX5_9STRA|nr:hypothetical protein NSK_007438 [Nannochloropsis salina CCMP1776]|eukprot:TFJ81221.1 hypothetical protein NSK_007438 [Nannochloropsis salina CCMP1776]